MPSVVDMGLGGVLNGQQSNFLNDPSVLLGMLSLRERQKARQSDEAYRNERAAVSDAEFARTADQRDQQIAIQQAAGQRAQATFDRGVKQEDAGADLMFNLANDMGWLEDEDPITGARSVNVDKADAFRTADPQTRQQFAAMKAQEMADEAEQRKAVEAQMQTQQLLGGFQKQLMGAAETGDLDETMAQMFAERMQGAVTGASGEKPFQVMEDFQAVRQQSMAQRVESERRLGVATGVQEQLMLSTANNPQLNAQAAMLLDGYTSGGLTDDQFFDGLNTIQKTQAAAQKATTGDMTGLLTQVYKYPPEQAALINAALSSGALDFSRLEQVPGPDSVTDADRIMVQVASDRAKSVRGDLAIPDEERAAAEAALDQAVQSATGRSPVSSTPEDPDAIRRSAFEQALKEAQESGTVDRAAVEERARELIAEKSKGTRKQR